MNRRVFESVVLIVLLMQPVLGLIRLKAHHTLATAPPGSLRATLAQDAILTVQR